MCIFRKKLEKQSDILHNIQKSKGVAREPVAKGAQYGSVQDR